MNPTMLSKAKICVVDDEAVITDVLSESLRAHNFDTLTANNGQDAIELCKKNDIDLMLLDVMMPVMDGYEVCKALKSDEATKDIEVIFVTGKSEPENHEEGFKLGAIDYITKPFNLPMVMVRVEAALRMRQQATSDSMTDILQDLGDTDSVTGLKNQRYLLNQLQHEIDKSKRYHYPVSCVILDLDTIRTTDDKQKDLSVEDLLAEVAMEIRSFTRSYDILARFDGTLFAAVLPHSDANDAVNYGRKIMEDIDATTFSDPNAPTKVSVSVSAVTVIDGALTDAELVFGETMKLLLQAKSMPKNNRIKGREINPA